MTFSKQEIEAMVQAVPVWYHSMHLGNPSRDLSSGAREGREVIRYCAIVRVEKVR
jgi:hypothetical protein